MGRDWWVARQGLAVVQGSAARKAWALIALLVACWLGMPQAAHAAKILCFTADGQAQADYINLCDKATDAYPAGGLVEVTKDNTTLVSGTAVTEADLTGYDLVVIATVYRRPGDLPAVNPVHWPVIEAAIEKRLSNAFWIMADACCGTENLQAGIDITNRASGGLFNLAVGARENGFVTVNRNPSSNFTASFTQTSLSAAVFYYFAGAPFGYVLYGAGTTAAQIGAQNEEIILPSSLSFGGTGACIFLGSDVNVVQATPPAGQGATLFRAHLEAATAGGSCYATPPARPTISMAFSPSYLSHLGGTTRLTISIGNSNADPLIVQSASMALPASVTNAAAANAVTTCRNELNNGPALVNAANGGSVIGLQASSLIPPGGCIISVDITAQPGSYSIVLRSADFLTSSGLPAGDASLALGPPPPAVAIAPVPLDLRTILLLQILLVPGVVALLWRRQRQSKS